MMEYKKSIAQFLDDMNLDINFNLSDKNRRRNLASKKEIESIVGSNNSFNINIINGRFDVVNLPAFLRGLELLGAPEN